MNTVIKAQRAYRTIKSIELPYNGGVIEAGTYMYCEKIRYRSGLAQMVYLCGDNVMILKMPMDMAASHLIFAKFIHMPERLRTRFGIRADGTRARILKGQVYTLTDELEVNGQVIAPGTPFLCIKGGERPHLSYARSNGVLDYLEAVPSACVLLNEASPIAEVEALQSMVATIHEATYQNVGERPVFSATIELDGKMIIVERTSKFGSTRYREMQSGAAAEIITRLQQVAPVKCDPLVLLESYVLYTLFGKGAGNFIQLQAAIVRDIEKNVEALAQRSSAIASTPNLRCGNVVAQYNHRKGGFSYRRYY